MTDFNRNQLGRNLASIFKSIVQCLIRGDVAEMYRQQVRDDQGWTKQHFSVVDELIYDIIFVNGYKYDSEDGDGGDFRNEIARYLSEDNPELAKKNAALQITPEDIVDFYGNAPEGYCASLVKNMMLFPCRYLDNE